MPKYIISEERFLLNTSLLSSNEERKEKYSYENLCQGNI